jgi:hypothetical protein
VIVPAIDHGPAWRVRVIVRGRIARDSFDADAWRIVEAHVRRIPAPLVVDGWLLHVREGADAMLVLSTPPGVVAAIGRDYADALFAAYAPSALPPPAPSSHGPSGAPALIAAFTPARAN